MSFLIYHKDHQHHRHDRFLFYNYFSSILFLSQLLLLTDDFALYCLVFFLFFFRWFVWFFFIVLFFVSFVIFVCFFAYYFKNFKTVSWKCRDNFNEGAFGICFILFRTNLICHLATDK